MDVGSFTWGVLAGSAGTIVALVKLIQYGKRETERKTADTAARRVVEVNRRPDIFDVQSNAYEDMFRRN